MSPRFSAALALLPLLGCDPEPRDCEALTGGSRDTCLLEQASELAREDPRAALALARKVSDPADRELAIFGVMRNKASGLSERELRQICDQELTDPSLRDRCRREIERHHMRTEVRGGGDLGPEGPLREGNVPECEARTGPARDNCYASRALGERGDAASLRALIEPIASADTRGQTVVGVLRQPRPITSMDQLEDLATLLDLAGGPWRAEAASLLGAELPARVARDCGARPECEALTVQAGVWGLEVCAQAGELRQQCFDHVCMASAEQAVQSTLAAEPEAFAAALVAARDADRARDRRIEDMPGCHAVWAGRKLVQRSPGAPERADARCAALRAPDDSRCRSGLAEELLADRLRSQPVADVAALERLVTTDAATAFPNLPAPARELLPCGAFSVLTGKLAPGLGSAPPVVAERLRLADPRCAWGGEP